MPKITPPSTREFTKNEDITNWLHDLAKHHHRDQLVLLIEGLGGGGGGATHINAGSDGGVTRVVLEGRIIFNAVGASGASVDGPGVGPDQTYFSGGDFGHGNHGPQPGEDSENFHGGSIVCDAANLNCYNNGGGGAASSLADGGAGGDIGGPAHNNAAWSGHDAKGPGAGGGGSHSYDPDNHAYIPGGAGGAGSRLKQVFGVVEIKKLKKIYVTVGGRGAGAPGGDRFAPGGSGGPGYLRITALVEKAEDSEKSEKLEIRHL